MMSKTLLKKSVMKKLKKIWREIQNTAIQKPIVVPTVQYNQDLPQQELAVEQAV